MFFFFSGGRVFDKDVSFPPGHEGVPAYSDGSSDGNRKCSSRDEHLAGVVSHHQRAQHT